MTLHVVNRVYSAVDTDTKEVSYWAEYMTNERPGNWQEPPPDALSQRLDDIFKSQGDKGERPRLYPVQVSIPMQDFQSITESMKVRELSNICEALFAVVNDGIGVAGLPSEPPSKRRKHR